jgi:hypothetical protein
MPDDLIVGDRVSFNNQFRIPNVSNLRCSWEISRIGLLSADIPERDLLQVLPPGKKTKDLLRQWVKYTHPTAGTWGGVINSVSVEDGIASIDAESWVAMLRGKLTYGMGAGTLISGLKAMIDRYTGATGITWGGAIVTSDGAPDDYTFKDLSKPSDFFTNGQDICDAFLPAVMEAWYQQYAWAASLRTLAYHVDPETRVFTVDPTYGRDLTQTVALRDGVHILNSGWTDDIEDIFNHVWYTASYNTIIVDYASPIYGEAPCTHYKMIGPAGHKHRGPCDRWGPQPIKGYATYPAVLSGTAEVGNDASQAKYGARSVIISSSVVFNNLNEVFAQAHLICDALSREEQIVSLEIADVDGIFARFREGDALGVALTTSGRTGNMLARARAYDGARGTLLVSGEAQLL